MLKVKIGQIIGDKAPLVRCSKPTADFHEAWSNFWNDYAATDRLNMPNNKPPQNFVTIDRKMRKLVSATDITKIEKTEEGRRLLDLFGYRHIIADLQNSQFLNLAKWEDVCHRPWFMLCEESSILEWNRCLFDQDHAESLVSQVRSNETLVLVYFGHSEYETGEWIMRTVSEPYANSPRTSASATSASSAWESAGHWQAFRRLLSKFVSRLVDADGNATRNNVGLVIVANSCCSGLLCEQLRNFQNETVLCSSGERQVSEVLQRSSCAIAVQASCASDQLAYSRFFTPLFVALQKDDTFNFYSVIKQLLVDPPPGAEHVFAFNESPSLLRLRPLQTPQHRTIGPAQCASALQQCVRLFDETDARPLRVFWEFYGGLAQMSDDDKFCSASLGRKKKQKTSADAHPGQSQPVPTGATPSAAPSNAAPSAAPSNAAPSAAPSNAAPSAAPSNAAPSAAPSNADEKASLCGQLHPVEDTLAFTAGKNNHGFISVVSVNAKKYSVHIHCTPVVVARELTFNPRTDDTTQNYADLECMMSEHRGVAFLVVAADEIAAQTVVRNYYGISATELTEPVRVTVKDERLFLFGSVGDLTQRFADFLNAEKPVFRQGTRLTMFHYPNRQFYVERAKRPLITGAVTDNETQWLRGMLANVKAFLANNAHCVIYARNSEDKLVGQTVAEWCDAVAWYFEQPRARFQQFEMYGSVGGSIFGGLKTG